MGFTAKRATIGWPVEIFCWLRGAEAGVNPRADAMLREAGFRFLFSNFKVQRLAYAKGVEYVGTLNDAAFALNIRGEDCGGQPMTATLRANGKTYAGCASPGAGASGISPWLMRWALAMMRLASACRNTSVSRATGTTPELMMSAST